MILLPIYRSSIQITPCESQKTAAITFPADKAVFAYFGAHSSGELHCFCFLVLLGVPVDTCFVDGYEAMQKLHRITLKQCQTLLCSGFTAALVARSE